MRFAKPCTLEEVWVFDNVCGRVVVPWVEAPLRSALS